MNNSSGQDGNGWNLPMASLLCQETTDIRGPFGRNDRTPDRCNGAHVCCSLVLCLKVTV